AYEAVAVVADRLALVVGALLAAIALAWAVVLYTYRWFASHADALLARALRWTRDHPRLGRYAAALISPNRPESASLALLAACLLAIGIAWFTLLATMLAQGGPLALDLRLHEAMYALRNPLSDRLMAGLASIGDPVVLAMPIAVSTLWLLWRRRWMAAAHWLAALAFGLVLTAALEAAIDMPRPPTALSGFGFPSVGLTMTTITFGFFAVLIARELPGRQRVWPYLVSGAVVAVLGFARLCLGAHWLTDLVGGMLLGVAWLLALGIAYRRHVARSFWMRPLAALFYGAFLVAALWHAPRAVGPLLDRFAPLPPPANLELAAWWEDGWAELPGQRNERDASRRWPLDVQVAGPLAPLEARLRTRGWRVQPQADWRDALLLLDDDTPALAQKVLPATLGASAEALLLRRTLDDGRLVVLRLWRAPRQPRDGTPLWIGTAQVLAHQRPFDLFGLWSPQSDAETAYGLLRGDLGGFAMREGTHPASGQPVLRLRTPVGAAGGAP